MKKLCICLCCVLLLLTACGRAQTVLKTEATTATAETALPQTRTETGLTRETTTQLSAALQTEPPTEPVTTGVQPETQRESPSVTAAQPAQTTRQTHTLFPIPDRTIGTQTQTAAPHPTGTTAADKTTAANETTTGTSWGSGITVQSANTCTVTIDCRELRDHPEKLKKAEKAAFVPKNGYIVQNVTMEFKDGDSVYDVLRRVCETHTCTDNCRFCAAEGIQMESSYSPQFDSYYVEGIHQLYEKDCGGTSGWTYYVNGRFPNYGSSACTVKSGDRIEWVYSVELDENEKFE